MDDRQNNIEEVGVSWMKFKIQNLEFKIGFWVLGFENKELRHSTEPKVRIGVSKLLI